MENAILEARNCLEFIKGKTFELGVYYDLENEVTEKCGRIEITQMAINFCNEIKSAGFIPGVYANLNWFTNYIEISKLEGFKIWVAEWGVNKPKIKCNLWQYADNGKIEGISGNVDLNYLITEDLLKNEIQNNGGDVEVKVYKNGSTIEPVYSNSRCTNLIGHLNPYEECDCFGVFNNKAMVRYKVDGKEDYKIGFVMWLGRSKKLKFRLSVENVDNFVENRK